MFSRIKALFTKSKDGDSEPIKLVNRKLYLNCKPGQLQKQFRHDADLEDPTSVDLILPSFPNNQVRTTKYNFYNFLPKNLYLQFQRAANIYFLFLIILQLLPNIGDGLRAALMGSMSFGTILLITMIKDGYEDFIRLRSDKELNNQPTLKLEGFNSKNVKELSQSSQSWFSKFKSTERLDEKSMDTENGDDNEENIPLNGLDSPIPEKRGDVKWAEVLWKDILVGDMVKLKSGESIPSDMILLDSSDPDKICYIETKNLDGETNLKIKHCLDLKLDDVINRPSFIECEPPNVNLYQFNGSLSQMARNDMTGKLQLDQQTSISVNNLLLRGCIVKDVDYVIGVVIYTGHESKIVLNSGDTPVKTSYIERMMNTQVLMNFVILIFLCLVVAISGTIFYRSKTTSAYYFITGIGEELLHPAFYGLFGFFTSLILFQNIVPISLYLTVEMVKSIQAYFIHCDLKMYYEPLDKLCVPRAWNLSDDLGQIEYIFSDKTGTLTQNIMQFKQCTINGIMYGHFSSTEANDTNPIASNSFSASTRPSMQYDDTSQLLGSNDGEDDRSSDDRSSISSDLACNSSDRIRIMGEERDRISQNRYRSGPITFVDHQLYMDLRNNPTRSKLITEYFKMLAICHTVLPEIDHSSNVSHTQITYKAQSPDEAALVAGAANAGYTFLSRTQNKVEVSVLGKLESYEILTVLEFNSTRKRMSVIVKDPESDGYILYCKGADSVILERLRDKNQDIINDTLGHLQAFAQSGLRTLCFGYKQITKHEFEQWNEMYMDANNAISNRDDKVSEVCELIERDLVLLGGSAIEDKLQDGVPEAIALLRQAGLKIWVLTGDKTETAINIGFSCHLLSGDMSLIVVDGSTLESVSQQLSDAIKKFVNKDGNSLALIIDGSSLKFALLDECNHLLLELGQSCESVICCRVSPLQKAQVVDLVKSKLDAMSLAIGDGANDVSMIQAAHIGVGIAGLEGYQAVMSSDYAIGQFRYLTRLLLVHGRWSYIRISHMILCFFYKNLVMTLANFWFQFYNGPSQTFLFDYAIVLCYNLVFTAFPIMILGAFDQDVSAEVALVTPQLYKAGIKHQSYSHFRFFTVVIDALYQSLVCFYMPYLMFGITTFSMSGNSTNSWDGFGTMVSACVVVTTNLYVGIFNYHWTWLMFSVVGGSIVIFFVMLLIFSHIVRGMNGVDSLLFASMDFWIILILTVIGCLLPRLAFRFLKTQFQPHDIDIIREQVLLFTNYLKRQTHKLKKINRKLQKQHQIGTDQASHGNYKWPNITQIFNMNQSNSNLRPMTLTGYAFSMGDEAPPSMASNLKHTLLDHHIQHGELDTDTQVMFRRIQAITPMNEDHSPSETIRHELSVPTPGTNQIPEIEIISPPHSVRAPSVNEDHTN